MNCFSLAVDLSLVLFIGMGFSVFSSLLLVRWQSEAVGAESDRRGM